MIYDAIVIGAGAAALFFGALNKDKLNILMLERNDRVGKKLLTTGNGRCNYTNTKLNENPYNDKDFTLYMIEKYGYEAIKNKFQVMGIYPYMEEDRVYPMSLQASSVLDVLRYENERNNINIKTDVFVKSFHKDGDIFIIKDQNANIYKSKSLVIACGGAAMPKFGSDANLFKQIKELGISVHDTKPALVPYECDYKYLKHLDGLRVKAKLSLKKAGKIIKDDVDDVLFTKYGLSGPTVFQLSRYISGKESAYKFSVDFFYTFNEDELFLILSDRRKDMGYKSLDDFFIGLIHKRLIIPVLDRLGIVKETNAKNLSDKDLHKIINILKDFELDIIKNKGYGIGQISLGGVATKEINAKTMESKKINGLYFIGEVIDIDGPCGGYNLSFAWLSAMAAYDDIKLRCKAW